MNKRSIITLAFTLVLVLLLTCIMIFCEPTKNTVDDSKIAILQPFEADAGASASYPKAQLSAMGFITVESDGSTTYMIPLQTSTDGKSTTKFAKINSSSIPCWTEASSEKDETSYILRFSEDENYIYFQMVPSDAVIDSSLLGTKLE